MQAFADRLIESLFSADPATWAYTHFFYFATILAFCALVFFGFVLPFAGVATWAERKISARMQSRIGPNRAGPHGFLIWIADGVKLLLKEDLIPDEADRPLFRLGPYLVLVGLASSFVVLPFAAGLVIADLNLGLFFLMAVTSIEVVGIMISGWASNSKWSLLGGFRSAAQIISYEIPVALAFMVVAISAGTLSLPGIIGEQGWSPHEWYLFRSPMHFTAFWIYVIAALAEGNRTPFDLPEAESELVSGFNTEYSGLRFSSYFMAEFANIWVMNAVGVVLFLGGWQVPWSTAGALGIAGSFLVFAAKTFLGVFVVLWIRWTLPRIRIDQMMDLCWKYLVPIGIGMVVLAAMWEIVLHSVPALSWIFVIPLMAFTFGTIAFFLRRVWRNLGAVGDEFSWGNW